MARIRNVKPEFFLHDELFDLESKTGLPVRLAFIGLWTQADREGRFRWQPRRLKASVLPYDSVDFEQILKALCDGGFIQFYQVGGESFGVIPNFAKHQCVSKREPTSTIPDPSQYETSPVPERDQSMFGPTDIGHRTLDIGQGTLDAGHRTAADAAVVAGRDQDKIPPELDTPEFKSSWSDYLKHRSEIRKPLKRTSTSKLLARLAKLGPAKAIEAIEHSVANGWQGIFEPRAGPSQQNGVRRKGVVFDPNEKVNHEF